MRNEIISGRYRILERLGEGGMAVVYTARDEKLGRVVAIKLLHQHFSDNQDIRQRFEHEARAISVLDHPNIVKVFDYSGTSSEQLWIVTELLKGQNLANFVRGFEGTRLHPIIAACVAREICRALEHAHSREIVHRDIKPENVMMLDSGPNGVKLMDFGIAKNLHNNSLTQTGTFMGSPSYMSPEQVRGRGVDHRADIYSLGVVLYEIVVGRLPYIGNTTHDVVLKIVEGQFTKPSEILPDLPRDLDKIICKAMASDPERRFQQSKAVGRELDVFLTRSGFVESHVELERYLGDRTVYEERLGRLNLKLEETRHRYTEQTRNQSHAKTMVLQPNGGAAQDSQKLTRSASLHATQKLDQMTRQHNQQALDRPKTQHQALDDLKASQRQTHGTRRDRSIPPQFLPPVGRKTQARKNVVPNFPRDQFRQSIKVPPQNNGAERERTAAPMPPAKRRRQVPKLPRRTAHRRELIVVRTAYRPPAVSLTTMIGWIAVLVAVAGGVFWYLQNVQFPTSQNLQRDLKQLPKSIDRGLDEIKGRIDAAIQPETPPVTAVSERPKVSEIGLPNTVTKPKTQVTAPVHKPKPKRNVPVAKNPENRRPTRNVSIAKAEPQNKELPIIKRQLEPAREVAVVRPPMGSAAGKIVIRDTPPAVIYVNNEFKCRIPCSAAQLTLSAGSYELRAERTGFEPSRQSVTVRSGETSTIRFDLLPASNMKLIFDWDTTAVDIRVFDVSGVQVSRKRFGLATDTIELPVSDYNVELRKGAMTKQIRVGNPGGGATRYVVNPFAGGG